MKHSKIKDAFEDKSIKVPFFSPLISKQDKKVVNETLDTLLLTDGPKLRKFESDFAKFTNSKYAIGVSNGTAALHLSLSALGIGKGDEVIIPDMTFIATASAVLLCGATPVLADVELDDFGLSTKSIEKSITTKTKLILPVHFAGRVCEINKIRTIAKKHHLMIIEDCAHAIGSKIGRKHVGTFGDAGCFSFYPTKNITTIEGGMVTTNSKKVANYVMYSRNHGITRTLTSRYSKGKPWDYDVSEPGYNYRLDEIRSSLGINQLKNLNNLNKKRKKAFEYYNSKLSSIDGIITPKITNANAYHLYIIRIQKEYGLTRNQLFKKLLKQGIRTSVHYKPLHNFSLFKKQGKIYDKLKNSEFLYNEIISLPLFPHLSKKEQDYVVKCLKER